MQAQIQRTIERLDQFGRTHEHGQSQGVEIDDGIDLGW
jgi:hypothetical protein